MGSQPNQTRWVWIRSDAGWVLAFTYVDPVAGPSAKGGLVGDPPSWEQIRAAIDHPDRTFRQPLAFGAISIRAEDALRFGLPRDPPWIGHFDGRPIPPPRDEASRTIVATVLRDGVPAAGVRVRMGHVFGPARELVKLDERTSDAWGRVQFPLAPLTTIAAIADTATEGSALVDIPESDVVELHLTPYGAIEGFVTRAGIRARGRISITGLDGGTHKVRSSDATGRYRIEQVLPGCYAIEVTGIDPQTHMSCGTPTRDEAVVWSGQTLRRDYTLVAGVTVHVVAAVEHDQHWGSVFLFAGHRDPSDSNALRELWRGLDKSLWRSANSLTNDGRHLRCKFADVEPGTYTLCVTPDKRGPCHDAQPVVSRTVVVNEDATVEVTVPPLRRQ